jgi:hypothetical protein
MAVIFIILGVAYFVFPLKIFPPPAGAENTATQFYSYIEVNDIQGASTLYDGVLLHPAELKNMSLIITTANSKLGSIINYSLTGYTWKKHLNNTGGPVATVNLSYYVSRTKYNTYEHILLYQDNSSAPFRIAGYYSSCQTDTCSQALIR